MVSLIRTLEQAEHRDIWQLFAEAKMIDPVTDPQNPWPPGCDWHRKHNEIWRRRRARKAALRARVGNDG